MKPWIGITTYDLVRGTAESYDTQPLRVVESAFEKAVWKAGGIPILLPQVISSKEAGDLCMRLDGLILVGGNDVDPKHYGEEPRVKLGKLDPARDQSDMAYIEACNELYIPVLGVCRGMQLLNVAYGGSLYQDLSEIESWKIQHDQATPVSEPLHEIKVEENTILSQLLKSENAMVNTVHHQAIKDLSPQFEVSARSSDGIVEAIESAEGPAMLGIQWHPELLFEKSEEQLAIFKWLTISAVSCDC